MSLRRTGVSDTLVTDTEVEMYSGPCDLRLPIWPAKYGLKLKVVLK